MAASSAPVKKSNTGKLVFVVLALSFASVMLAWQFGLFGGGSAKPDPKAPPAVVETKEEKVERENVEETIKTYNDENDVTPTGS
jgi:hypothetical protein